MESLCKLFPAADIYTHVYDPAGVSDIIRRHNVYTTFISKLPLARTQYKRYLPLMPYALEELDLARYDLVISSEAGPAKGIIKPPGAFHLCYCHTPMRYLWDQYHVYRENSGAMTRFAMSLFARNLRVWDSVSASRVDQFVANSSFVAKRINAYYKRDAVVIHPPVSVEKFSPAPHSEIGDFYLWAGELVRYKRPDIAIEAFNRLGKKLVVIGGGGNRRLYTRARDNISFLGNIPLEQLRWHFSRCKALVFPGEEDFGMVPVEVMASGRPVIAYRGGGALDTVTDETGLFFDDQTADGLVEAVMQFERDGIDRCDTGKLVSQSQRFSEPYFHRGIKQILEGHGISLKECASPAPASVP